MTEQRADAAQCRRAATMAAAWWAERLEQGDRAVFARILEEKILTGLLEHPRQRVDLVCDYDPWDLLLDALREAGSPCAGELYSARGILPSKHELEVTPWALLPKAGYGNWLSALLVPTESTP